ncbi:MAG: DUF4373 domain-containing protein [Candidatus Bilamarchaeaceae archaeon]
MARPIKTGLDYFPLDTYFFEDTKVEFISSKFGHKGEIILIKLLMKIYREFGYYMPYNDDTITLFAKRAGSTISVALVRDVVMESVKRGLFDESILLKFNVLTSRGIQKRYYKVCTESKRKEIIILPEYDLIGVSPGNTPEKTEFTPEETQLTHGESTQRKEKKIYNNRERDNTHASNIPDIVFEIWRIAFGRNPNYLEAEFCQKLISIAGEKEAERHIRELSKCGFRILKTMEDQTIVEEIIENGGIKKVFSIKPKGKNGTNSKINQPTTTKYTGVDFDKYRRLATKLRGD